MSQRADDGRSTDHGRVQRTWIVLCSRVWAVVGVFKEVGCSKGV
jgi:hypothetical protein